VFPLPQRLERRIGRQLIFFRVFTSTIEWNSEDITVYKIIYTAVDEEPEVQFKYLKILVGERGFEPPTPWSRTWGPGANFVATQSFEWCFNRLILSGSRQFGRNVNPAIATLARVSPNWR
jgi:hypothetical protein